jgi:hypothetical protein
MTLSGKSSPGSTVRLTHENLFTEAVEIQGNLMQHTVHPESARLARTKHFANLVCLVLKQQREKKILSLFLLTCRE